MIIAATRPHIAPKQKESRSKVMAASSVSQANLALLVDLKFGHLEGSTLRIDSSFYDHFLTLVDDVRCTSIAVYVAVNSVTSAKQI